MCIYVHECVNANGGMRTGPTSTQLRVEAGCPHSKALAAPDYTNATPGGVGVGGSFLFFSPTELFRTSVRHPFVVRGWGEVALLAVWQTLVPSAVFGETNTSLGKMPQCLLQGRKTNYSGIDEVST